MSRIPDSVGLTDACVIPLCLATAISGLYEQIGLNLENTGQTDTSDANEKAILIWGGSSVVGSCAIQLCAAAGLTVLSTASAKNFHYVKRLGADYVFDHADKDVIKKLIDSAAGKTIVGAYDAISNRETSLQSAEFLHAHGGGTLYATRPSDFGAESVLRGDVRRVAGKSTLP